LSLHGSNTYTGGTTLNSGGAILGNNASFGTGDVSVTGDFTLESNLDDRRFLNNFDVETGATLSFTGESVLQQFGTVISGLGALNVDLDTDDDEIVLRGVNTYEGGTTLTQGTIILGNNAALGDGTLTLAGDGTIESSLNNRIIDNDIDTGNSTLTFDGDRDLRLTGVISGTGGLTLDAAATLTVTGNNTMTGLTQINMGSHLEFDGGTLRGSVDINDGGLLTGDGRILGVASDLTLRTGGTLSPGDTIGTIEVGGDYLQETGSTLIVELDTDSGDADLLDVTGAATLESGSTIEASLMGEAYIASGQQFAIIEADGGITDNGVQLVTDSVTVTVGLIPDPNFVDGAMTWSIELSRAADAYSAAAVPGNNSSIGGGLDSTIAVANADTSGAAASLLGRLDALDADTYNQAVSQLSPEPLNASNATNLYNIRNFTTEQVAYLATVRAGANAAPMPTPGPLPGSMALAANDPLLMAAAIAQADEATQPDETDTDLRWGRYFKVSGVFAEQDTTANRTGFDATAFGAQIGLDYSFSPNFVAGLALEYMYTDADLKLDLGNIQDQAIRFGPYASYYTDDWYIDASATFAWHFYNSDRNNPTLGLSAHGDYQGYDFTGYLGTGYRFHVDRNLTVTPIASVLYSHFYYENFTEIGSGGMPLTLPSRNTDSLRSRLGASVAYRVPGLKFRPIPYLYMGWEHEFLNDESIDAAFASGGNPFTVDVGTGDTDAFFLGGGINILINRNVSAFFRIEALTGSTSSAVGAAAGVSVAF
jgi:autotransporter-associated beta strand protein